VEEHLGCYQESWPLSLSPSPVAGSAIPNSQSKHQFIKAVHVEVAKEHEDIAANLVHKALHSKAFWHTTSLMMKLVPLYSEHIPLAQQDIPYCTIMKQVQCLGIFEHISNPHIDFLDDCSDLPSNHSFHSIALSYQINCKAKTFLSLDHNHSNGEVIFTYPWKYQEVANSKAHHLVKYMKHKNGSPALCWFNYADLAAASEIEWNKEEKWPVP